MGGSLDKTVQTADTFPAVMRHIVLCIRFIRRWRGGLWETTSRFMVACVCGYISNDSSNRRRHEKNCFKRRVRELETRVVDMETCINSKDALLLENDKTIRDLKRTIANLTRPVPKKVTNNVCIVQNNIYPFCEEPRVVPPQLVQQFLKHEPDNSVLLFVQIKHFSGPVCTQNIHLPNCRGNTVQVVQRNGSNRLEWVHRSRRGFLNELMTINLNELMDKYAARSVREWEDWYLRNQLDNAMQRPRNVTWKQQISKLDLLLINHRRTIELAAAEDRTDDRK